jgi:hypothetical protein
MSVCVHLLCHPSLVASDAGLAAVSPYAAPNQSYDDCWKVNVGGRGICGRRC